MAIFKANKMKSYKTSFKSMSQKVTSVKRLHTTINKKEKRFYKNESHTHDTSQYMGINQSQHTNVYQEKQ